MEIPVPLESTWNLVLPWVDHTRGTYSYPASRNKKSWQIVTFLECTNSTRNDKNAIVHERVLNNQEISVWKTTRIEWLYNFRRKLSTAATSKVLVMTRVTVAVPAPYRLWKHKIGTCQLLLGLDPHETGPSFVWNRSTVVRYSDGLFLLCTALIWVP